jgi:hypothetical protein
MVLIYQPPNAHVRISWILLRNAMAAAAVKKTYNVVMVLHFEISSILSFCIWLARRYVTYVISTDTVLPLVCHFGGRRLRALIDRRYWHENPVCSLNIVQSCTPHSLALKSLLI